MEPIPLHQIQRISSEEDRPQYEPLTMPIPRLQSTTSWKFIHNLPSFRAPHPKLAYKNLAVFPIKNNNNNDNNTAVGVSPSLSSKNDKITLSPSLPATATYQSNQLQTQTSHNEAAAAATTTVSTPHPAFRFDVLDLEPRDEICGIDHIQFMGNLVQFPKKCCGICHAICGIDHIQFMGNLVQFPKKCCGICHAICGIDHIQFMGNLVQFPKKCCGICHAILYHRLLLVVGSFLATLHTIENL